MPYNWCMRSLILDGTAADDEFGVKVGRELARQLGNDGSPPNTILLREAEVAACTGCFGCWIKTPGTCVVNDAGRGIAPAVMDCDMLVLLTPLTFGCFSSTLKKGIDRMIPILSPFFVRIKGEVHHKKRYRKYPQLLGLATAQTHDAEGEEIFSTLVTRNALNWHSPNCAAGVVYADQDDESLSASVSRLIAEAGGEA